VPILGLPGPLCSRLRPDVRDRRQTNVRRHTKALLNAPPIRGGGIINHISITPYGRNFRTAGHVCERLAQDRYSAVRRLRVEPARPVDG